MKWGRAAVGGVVDDAFRKNQDGVAAVGGFAREAEALPNAGKLWKRKNVEERGDQEVAELVGPAFCKKPFARWSAHADQRFSPHGGGQAMAKTRRKRGEDQADIGAASDVIGNDDGRGFEIFQVVAAHHARMAENLSGRPHERVINDQAREADGFALCPAGIVAGGVLL